MLLTRPAIRIEHHERVAATVAGGGAVAFAVFGFGTGAPSTLGYLCTVSLAGLAVLGVRREPLPRWLAAALAALALGHLAGGLVPVGGDVLYNAHPSGLPVLQYDHVFHASASAIAALVLWRYVTGLVGPKSPAYLLAALGGLGVGAVNELVEFVATLAHDGSHVGGYTNTGWDLVSNTVGTAVALVVARRRLSS